MTDNNHTHASSDELADRATKGAMLNTLVAVCSYLLSILQLSILARFLTPTDFGIMALGTVVLTGAMTFTQLGTEKIIIQRQQMPNDFTGAIWLLNILRALVVAAICCLSAPLYAKIVDEPSALPVILILSLVPILSSLRSPAALMAERRLDFAPVAKYQLIVLPIQFIVMVALGYWLRDVFALAVGQVVVALFSSLLTWPWFGILSWPKYNKAYIKELLGQGRHYFVIAVGTFVMTQADNLLIGSYLGAAILGFYALAYKFSQWGVDLSNAIVARVALPVYSSLQTDSANLRNALDTLVQVQMLILLPMCATLYLFAEPIVNLVLGDEYESSVTLLQILVLVTFGRGISHIYAPLIIGAGHVHFASRIKIVETTLFLIAIWIGVYVAGADGVALGAGCVYLFSGLARMIYSSQVAGSPFVHLITVSFKSLFPVGIATTIVLLARYMMPYQNYMVLFEFIVFSVVYIYFSWLTQPLIQEVISKVLTKSNGLNGH